MIHVLLQFFTLEMKPPGDMPGVKGEEVYKPSATAAVCVVLIPLVVVVGYQAEVDLGVLLVLSGLLAFLGVVFSVAGVRQGGGSSRAVTWVCLCLLLLLTAAVGGLLASFRGQRWG